MWDFRIGVSLGLLARTWPYLLLRLGVYAGLSAMFVAFLGGGGALGHKAGSVYGGGPGDAYQYALFGAVGGAALGGLFIRLLREYLLYMVKAAHIAVIAQMIDGKALPGGRGQIAYGQALVAERFAEASALFLLDQLVKAVLRAFARTLSFVTGLVPVPGLRQLAALARAVIETSVTYVDEMILAHIVRVDSRNPFTDARNGLVLYAQNGRTMLRNAAWLTLFVGLMALAILALCAGPAMALFAAYPGPTFGYVLVAAMVLTLFLRATVLEPFAVACLLQVFMPIADTQDPDPDWERQLDRLSQRFGEIGQRALAPGLEMR